MNVPHGGEERLEEVRVDRQQIVGVRVVEHRQSSDAGDELPVDGLALQDGFGVPDLPRRFGELSEAQTKELAESLAAPVSEHLRGLENVKATPSATAAAR